MNSIAVRRRGRAKGSYMTPPEVRARALELVKQGVSLRRVGAQSGVSHECVALWLKTAGMKARGWEAIAERRAKGLAMVEAGRTIAEVAHELGVDRQTVWQWRRRAEREKAR